MGHHYSGPGRPVASSNRGTYNCFGQIEDVKRMRCRRMKLKIRQFTELCAIAVDNQPNRAGYVEVELRLVVNYAQTSQIQFSVQSKQTS